MLRDKNFSLRILAMVLLAGSLFGAVAMRRVERRTREIKARLAQGFANRYAHYPNRHINAHTN